MNESFPKWVPIANDRNFLAVSFRFLPVMLLLRDLAFDLRPSPPYSRGELYLGSDIKVQRSVTDISITELL